MAHFMYAAALQAYCCLSEECRMKQHAAEQQSTCQSESCITAQLAEQLLVAQTDVCHDSCGLLQIGARWGGTDFGGSENFPELKSSVREAMASGNTATYCETGFNLGQSAQVALLSNPHVMVHAFDMGVGRAPAAAAACLNATFGERLRMHWGDSTIAVPAAPRGLHCNVILIDGGHEDGVPQKDLANFRRLAAPGAFVIMDDVFCNMEHCMEPSTAWSSAIASGWLLQTSVRTRNNTNAHDPSNPVWGVVSGHYRPE